MAGRRHFKDTSSNRHKSRPTNAFLRGQSKLTSLTPSNQDAVVLAAAGAITAAPSPSSPLLLPTGFNTFTDSDSIRMQSGQLPGSIASSAQLATDIAVELKLNVVEVGCTFIDRLFPEVCAPFPIGKPLFDQLGEKALFDCDRNSFHPPADFGEATVCQWFNDIGQAMESATGAQIQRRWWYGTGTLPPSGSDYGFKPDLVLLEQSYYDTLSPGSRVDWHFVHSFTEVTSEKTPPSRMRQTINNKSYIMSTNQSDRRFVLALSLCGSCKFTFTLTDREGQIRFLGTALTDSNRDNASIFLRILSYLMFGRLSDIGLDTNFIRNPTTGLLVEVYVDGRRFQLLRRIYALEKMLGRSTRVWIVRSNNEDFIMKDSWVRVTEGLSEAECLKAMLEHDEIKNSVPTIVCGDEVKVNDKLDWTTAYRDEAIGPAHGRRVHRRMVTTPIGEPITSFKSKKELIHVIIDVIQAHDYLTKKLKILHGDISIGNVMISRRDGQERAHGLLIDFDYSTKLGGVKAGVTHSHDRTSIVTQSNNSVDPEMDEEGALERVWIGTPPFMAIAALINSDIPFKRSPCHDLESLLYVLIFLCTYTSGPGQTRQQFPPAMSVPLRQWFGNECIKDIGWTKLGHMSMPEKSILPKFDDYWSDFRPFVQELIQTCFPIAPARPNQLTHANMLTILESALLVVKDNDSATSTCSPVDVDNGKRPRMDGNSGVPPSKKGKRALSGGKT